MGILAHFKYLFDHAFEDCKPAYMVYLMKGYTVFCVLMLSMALYAFFYRVFTGFDF